MSQYGSLYSPVFLFLSLTPTEEVMSQYGSLFSPFCLFPSLIPTEEVMTQYGSLSSPLCLLLSLTPTEEVMSQYGSLSSPVCLFLFLYSYMHMLMQHHSDTIIKTDAMIKTQEDFFKKIFTPHFIARVGKCFSSFYDEREFETEHKL